MAGRKPDYNLSYLNKETGRRGPVGVGWRNPDGSISIQLNRCVVLRDDPAMVLTLFPADSRRENERPERVRAVPDSTPPDEEQF